MGTTALTPLRRGDGTIALQCPECQRRQVPSAQSPWVQENGDRSKLSNWVRDHRCEGS